MNEQRLAFTVTDAFIVHGLGLLLLPGVGNLAVPLRLGASLHLVRPDGSSIATQVQMLHPVHGAAPGDNPFLVLPDLLPADVPPGTLVHVLD